MKREVRVKVCGITSLEDARAAVSAGADWLGFNFYSGSPRFITPSKAHRIIEQLPRTVESVGVFVNEDTPESVMKIAKAAGVTVVQLHGDESPAYCKALKNLFVIKALRTSSDFRPEQAAQYETNAILLDAFAGGARGGTGETCDWLLARQTCEMVPQLFLAGGLTPENVAEAIAAVKPFAVDVCSGVESAPGCKDAVRMRRFVAAARGTAWL
ncbi:MAG: phosphoribosylanthranilate isomerase [Pyrinomonadaceae bacterium]|nr:phosphoribosylanthranilate isomerase [Pyrinomonadaceae bacterium]